MTRSSALKITLPLCVGMGFFVALSAIAYIPPSEFVVKNMTAKRAGPKMLKVRSSVRDLESKKNLLTLSYFSLETGRVVTHFFSPAGGVTPSIAANLSAKDAIYTYTSSIQKSEDSAPGIIPIALYSQDFQRVSENLIAAGVPIRSTEYLLTLQDEQARLASEVTSLKRWLGRPHWIYGGATHPAMGGGKPQSELWIEKDRFIMTRLMNPETRPGFEFRFESYQYSKDFPYPRKLSVVDQSRDAEVMTEEVLEFISLAAIEPSVLQARGKSTYSEDDLAGVQDSDLKRLIQTYCSFMR